jgi:polysaccharide biosynthesis protein PelD
MKTWIINILSRFRPETAGNRKKLFSWGGIFETALFLIILLAVNRFYAPEDPGFRSLSPHPFWAIIILVSVRFGLMESLLCALLAAATYSIFVLFPIGGQFYYSSLTFFADFKEPILFIILAAVISGYRENLVMRIRALRAELKEEEANSNQAEDTNRAVATALRELETRVAGQFGTVVDLFDSISSTRKMSPDEIKLSLIQVLKQHLQAEQCVYYDLQGSHLIRQHWLGNDKSEREEYSPGQDPVISEALHMKRVAYLAKLDKKDDFNRYRHSSLLAGPLMDFTGEVIGLVSIEKMPFIDYNPYSFKLFGTILNWWGKVLDERLHLEELSRKSVIDEETGMYTYSYFSRRVVEEFKRAKQYFIPLSVSLIRIDYFEEIPQHKVRKLRETIARIFIGTVAETEMVSCYKSDDLISATFPIVTGPEADQKVKEIVTQIDSFELHPYEDSGKKLSLSHFSTEYRTEMESFEELLDEIERGVEKQSPGQQDSATLKPAEESFTRKTINTDNILRDFAAGFLVEGGTADRSSMEQLKDKLSTWFNSFILSGGVLFFREGFPAEISSSEMEKPPEVPEHADRAEQEKVLIRLLRGEIDGLIRRLSDMSAAELSKAVAKPFSESFKAVFEGPAGEKPEPGIFRESHPDGSAYLGIDLRCSCDMQEDVERIRRDESLNYEIMMKTRPTRHTDSDLSEALTEDKE